MPARSPGAAIMTALPDSATAVPAEFAQALRDGRAEISTAHAVGFMLARIHGFSAARPELAAQFATDAIFFDIRLEPYLLATARRHAGLAPALERLVTATRSHTVALVHGDVSPKNILIGPHGPVMLDAECAWWGDPAFDIAFCLNHLLAQVPVERAGNRSVPCRLRCAVRVLPARRGLGAARRHRTPRRRAVAGPAAGARRWQVAGRIHHRGRATRGRQR